MTGVHILGDKQDPDGHTYPYPDLERSQREAQGDIERQPAQSEPDDQDDRDGIGNAFYQLA